MESNLELSIAHTKNSIDELSIERHKKEQKERMGSFIVGGRDNLGQSIVRVYAKGDEYAIYEVANSSIYESLKVQIDTIIDDDDEPIKRFNKIKPYFDEFIATLCKYSCDDSYKKRASTAITLAIHGDHHAAVSLFDKIKNDAENEHAEKIKGRLLYQSGSFTITFIISILATLTYFFRENEQVSGNPVLFEIILVSALSSMGGVLSISLKIKELTIDRGLEKFAYFMYGAERIFISIIAGVFLYVLIKSNLVFGIFSSTASSFFGILALSLLAGFSETLVPNTLKNLENETIKNRS